MAMYTAGTASYSSAAIGCNGFQWCIIHLSPQGSVITVAPVYLSKHTLSPPKCLSPANHPLPVDGGAGKTHRFIDEAKAAGKPITFGGDMRADSPGEFNYSYHSYIAIYL